jgi:hypothetical protein
MAGLLPDLPLVPNESHVRDQSLPNENLHSCTILEECKFASDHQRIDINVASISGYALITIAVLPSWA